MTNIVHNSAIPELEVHELARLFPDMALDEYMKLVADIKAHGLRVPILLSADGKILDGRHRYRACLETNTPITTTTCHLTDESAIIALLASLNLHRRSYTIEQLAVCFANLPTRTPGGDHSAQMQNAPTQADVARITGVSVSTGAKAVRIKKKSAALLQAVNAGQIKLNDAVAVIDMPQSEFKAAEEAVVAGNPETAIAKVKALAKNNKKKPAQPATAPSGPTLIEASQQFPEKVPDQHGDYGYFYQIGDAWLAELDLLEGLMAKRPPAPGEKQKLKEYMAKLTAAMLSKDPLFADDYEPA